MQDIRSLRKTVAVVGRYLKDATHLYPQIGLVLGTGWGDLLTMDGEMTKPLSELPGFKSLGRLEGHARHLVWGYVAGKPVVALRGRVHMNEHPTDPRVPFMVRLQVEILIALGVKTLILTAAAESLKRDVHVGEVVLVDGFVTLFMQVSPLFAGEFCSPEDTLDAPLRHMAHRVAPEALRVTKGGYAMLRGPFFEGRKYDKVILRQTGASVVGMSMVPEACVAATHPGVRVLGLAYVTNSAFEAHSHATNQARARTDGPLLDTYLKSIISEL